MCTGEPCRDCCVLEKLPRIAKHIGVGSAAGFDLCKAMGDHALPVLLSQWHCVQLHTSLLAHLSSIFTAI